MKSETKQNDIYPVKIQGTIKAESVIVWGLPIAFCVHLLDETLLNGGFVYGVRQHIWPAYTFLKFGLVNAAFILLISLSSYLYHKQPDKWIVLPLFWLWERSWNGVWHILWTLLWDEYPPGLGTSVLFGGLLWFALRGHAADRPPVRKVLFIGATGLVFEVMFISTLFISR